MQVIRPIWPKRCWDSGRWRRRCRPLPGWPCWWACRRRGPTSCPRGWTEGSSAWSCGPRYTAVWRCIWGSGGAPPGRRGPRSAGARRDTGPRYPLGRGCCGAGSTWRRRAAGQGQQLWSLSLIKLAVGFKILLPISFKGQVLCKILFASVF